jgi:hypothetical protein
MAERLPLSLVVITRDAARELPSCVASAHFAAETLVVDSGSTDGTVAIAQDSGARVLHRPFDGFGAQKRFAVSQATHDWVLCLDADERVSPELAAAIAAAFANGQPRAAAFSLSRRNRFLGRWLAHGEGYPDWIVRLFDRRAARWSDDPVHEKVVTAEPATKLAGDLLHDSAETLARYLEKQNRYTTLQAERLRSEGKHAGALNLVLSPLARFFKFYFLRLGFLDGVPGLVHVAIGCMNSFSKYAKLIELQSSR